MNVSFKINFSIVQKTFASVHIGLDSWQASETSTLIRSWEGKLELSVECKKVWIYIKDEGGCIEITNFNLAFIHFRHFTPFDPFESIWPLSPALNTCILKESLMTYVTSESRAKVIYCHTEGITCCRNKLSIFIKRSDHEATGLIWDDFHLIQTHLTGHSTKAQYVFWRDHFLIFFWILVPAPVCQFWCFVLDTELKAWSNEQAKISTAKPQATASAWKHQIWKNKFGRRPPSPQQKQNKPSLIPGSFTANHPTRQCEKDLHRPLI